MIITQAKKSAVKSHDFQETSCTIDAEDMRFVSSLLRNNYSNPTLATIREVIANAVDANLEASATKNIEVSLPTSLNPTFCVRDYGGGLSQEDMMELYSKFGKSTKRASNNYIGGFGIGKFAPLSYGDSFSVVSWNSGKKTTYSVFIDENEDTKILKLDESEIQQSKRKGNGLEIRVAVADEDVSNFREQCLKFLIFFRKSPTIINLGDDKVKDIVKFLEGTDDSWFFLETEVNNYGRYSHRDHNSSAIMGDVAYPIDPRSMNFSSYEDGNAISNLLSCDSLLLRFPIGALKLHHSRESIEYNKDTQEIICNKAREIILDMRKIATTKLKGAKDLWEAMKLYNSIANNMDHNLKDIFRNAFHWKGIKITSAYFRKERLPSSDYSTEDMSIKVYTKRDDEGIADGYAVKTQKESHAYAQKGSVLALDDVESPHGGALRARTIFNGDSDIESIFCIKFNNAEILKQFNKSQYFNKVSSDTLIKFSETEKAKSVRGTSSYNKGNSRANIALFEFDMESRGYRNTDWWNSSASKEVEDGIFVPIYNYRFVDSSTKNELMPLKQLRNALHELKEMKVKIPNIYGVRIKDMKKAEGLGLESIMTFYKREAKKLLNNKQILIKIADYDQLDSYHIEQWHHLESDTYCSKFFNYCKKNDLPKDSLMYKFLHLNCKKSSLMEDVRPYNRLISYLHRFDGDHKVLPEKPSFNYLSVRESVYETYPMLRHLTFADWGDHKQDKKIGLEYIKQMDNLIELGQSKKMEKVA
jgi:hypothetical protein